MVSHIAQILHTLEKYPFGCDFYNQNMIHLTENHFEKKRFELELSNTYTPNMNINPYGLSY